MSDATETKRSSISQRHIHKCIVFVHQPQATPYRESSKVQSTTTGLSFSSKKLPTLLIQSGASAPLTNLKIGKALAPGVENEFFRILSGAKSDP